eukprot:CAMPEP_0197488940 /NCGR_PEP_ID=MMETSP1311-20131121/3839_1 /TAXON_ID=464262 /ORGANISM="Genus nov. species nov., Strain RCC856" /LENGTH=511 /DNA_ID=CAMNT_0043033155 /DNA_START=199 /DNA_END=1734 /DNA_ORIENTATION=-
MRPAFALLCWFALLLLSPPRGCAGQQVSLSDLSNRYDDALTDSRMTKDRDVHRDAYELIVSKGYGAEKHSVTTEDGYVLQMIRIVSSPQSRAQGGNRPCPGSARKPAVLLQHGLIDSSATWVMNMPEQSLGFVLADAGYDVWLGNNRGTSYSMKHAELEEGHDSWDEEFWDFSWEDMAKYDLPAEIEYLLEVSAAEEVAYIAHSQGTTQAFAAFSMPEFADLQDKVNLHIALAPVAFVGNTESALFQIAGHLDVVRNFALIPELQSFGNTFLGSGAGANMIKALVPTLCDSFLGDCDGDPNDAHNSIFNTGMMGSLFGLPDMKHLNQSRIPVYLSHIPEGTSMKNLVHWSQAVRSKKFRHFDFGSCSSVESCPNTFRYGQGTPPDFDLSNYKVPTVLISGSKDPIANGKDVRKLIRALSENSGVLVRSKELESYDHNDFTIAMDGQDIFFPFLQNYLQEYACENIGGAQGAAAAAATGAGLAQEPEPAFEWGDFLDEEDSLIAFIQKYLNG